MNSTPTVSNGQTINEPTILVVEDDSAILRLVEIILAKGQYEVLSANSANEGLQIGTNFPRPIDLLLSDVVMPHMTGPDLAAKLKVLRPDMRVMLMSGYPDGAMLILNYGWHFINKPFVAKVLLERVQSILSSTTEEQGTDQQPRKAFAMPR
jgi:two-component system, cell cycle sensor histidine kinase and response regulator CckA